MQLDQIWIPKSQKWCESDSLEGCEPGANEMARAIVLNSEQWFLQSGTEKTDGGLIIGQLLLHM
jgi:hypothetical protein